MGRSRRPFASWGRCRRARCGRIGLSLWRANSARMARATPRFSRGRSEATVPFEYVDHAADVALRGIGETPEDAFVEAARAMWNLMIDLDAIAPRESLRIERSAGRLDLLLVEWLSA